MPEYRCKHCGKIVWRHSTKRWMKSWCEDTQQYTRLIAIDGYSRGAFRVFNRKEN